MKPSLNLPDYFLVDLPPEATLSPGMISQACQTLKRNRAQYLRSRSTLNLIRVINELAATWLDPDNPFRHAALTANPELTGFAPATLATGLDIFFRQLTVENLQALLIQDLGHVSRLDEPCSGGAEQKHRRAAVARGPELLMHLAAGNTPSAILSSMILGLLVRSAQFVKCATGAAYVPRLFAHSLYAMEPKLGACLEVAAWRGGHEPLEETLFAEVDGVTASGSDETLASIRRRLPPRVRFLGYGHRVSFGYLTSETLSGFEVRGLAGRAAADVVAWNQLGCLSPHVFYCESGGRVSGEEFAALLSKELARREEMEPRGPVPEDVAVTIASRRAFYEIRAAHSDGTKQWQSDLSTAWTVIYEADPRFQISCLHRFVYVKTVANLAEALQAADPVRGQVSTVGLAATDERAGGIALELAHWGVSRICPLGEMQNPPLTWRHDGRPALGDLVTWTDWERVS